MVHCASFSAHSVYAPAAPARAGHDADAAGARHDAYPYGAGIQRDQQRVDGHGAMHATAGRDYRGAGAQAVDEGDAPRQEHEPGF